MANNVSYINYLQGLADTENVVDKSYLQSIISQFQQLSTLSIVLPHSPAIFVIDYSKCQYVFFSNTIGDYSRNEIVKGGLKFMISLMERDYFKTFNEQVFPSILAFLQKIPTEQHSNYIISSNHRIKNADEKYIDIFQRSTYITSTKTGLPTHCIGMAIDISHFKNDTSINLSFEKKDTQTGAIKLLDEKIFSPHQPNALLNDAEKIMLQHICNGLSSKQIADKMFLSCRTIENKRLKMHAKTNTNNIAGLIQFAIKNKII